MRLSRPEETVLNTINPEDGLFDVLLVTVKPSLLRSLVSLAIRGVDNALAQVRVIQGREITIKATPNQEIRLDGEQGGNTPSRLGTHSPGYRDYRSGR